MWSGLGDAVQPEMPDGYVNALLQMVLQFFIPAEFIQELFFFLSKVIEKICTCIHRSCLPFRFELFAFVSWGDSSRPKEFHCCLARQPWGGFYFTNMKRSAGK